jgi:hypothetical protein
MASTSQNDTFRLLLLAFAAFFHPALIIKLLSCRVIVVPHDPHRVVVLCRIVVLCRRVVWSGVTGCCHMSRHGCVVVGHRLVNLKLRFFEINVLFNVLLYKLYTYDNKIMCLCTVKPVKPMPRVWVFPGLQSANPYPHP